MPAYSHGEAGPNRTAEYACWTNMLSRCCNPEHPWYHRYGGRGIAVCSRWATSYECFLLDMGRRPSARHSLDRINVDGNYEPLNCRWATHTTQQRNRCNNRLINAFGETRTLAEWAVLTGLKRETIARRIDAGCDSEVAVSVAPVAPALFVFRGSTRPVSEISRLSGVPINTLMRRLRRHGFNADLAVEEWSRNGRGRKRSKDNGIG